MRYSVCSLMVIGDRQARPLKGPLPHGWPEALPPGREVGLSSSCYFTDGWPGFKWPYYRLSGQWAVRVNWTAAEFVQEFCCPDD